MNSIDLLRHGYGRAIGVDAVLVESGKVHHFAIVKVGVEEVNWDLLMSNFI